jgi:hypothetical protein
MKIPTGRRVHRYLVMQTIEPGPDGQPQTKLIGLHESIHFAFGVGVVGIFKALDGK